MVQRVIKQITELRSCLFKVALWKGLVWQALGIAIRFFSWVPVLALLLVLSHLGEKYDLPHLPAILVGLGFILLWMLTYSLGDTCFYYGKRFLVPSAEKVLASDARPPVIYFRPFEVDSTAGSILELNVLTDDETEEMILANCVNYIGPCITVGRPGETLPQLGMARLYIKPEDEWQSQVEMLMIKARLVIIRIGYRIGSWEWELCKAIQSVSPKRLLLIVPYQYSDRGEDFYESFRHRFQAIFPKGLPDFQGKKIDYKSITGIIYFESDWIPHAISLDSLGESDFKGAMWKACQTVLGNQVK